VDGLGVPRYLNEEPILNASEPIKLNKADIAKLPSKIETLAQPWLELDNAGFDNLVGQIDSLEP